MSKEILDSLQPFERGVLQNLLYGISVLTSDSPENPFCTKMAECVIAATESRENLRLVFPDLDDPNKVTDEFWGLCQEARKMALGVLGRKE